MDFGLLDVRDGSTRRITNSPESNALYWLTANGKTLITQRTSTKRRIVTVDMTKALTKAK